MHASPPMPAATLARLRAPMQFVNPCCKVPAAGREPSLYFFESLERRSGRQGKDMLQVLESECLVRFVAVFDDFKLRSNGLEHVCQGVSIANLHPQANFLGRSQNTCQWSSRISAVRVKRGAMGLVSHPDGHAILEASPPQKMLRNVETTNRLPR